MFIRFVVPVPDEDSHCLTGVFQAAYQLRDRGLLSRADGEWFDGIRRWFNRHLPIPGRLSRSRRPHAHGNAVCWFKDAATDHIGRVRQLTALLERHGISTEVLRTERPGYVVYEDDFQVAAVPFRCTKA